MGFAAVAKHRSKNVTLYRQGDINFVLNAEPGSFAATFAEKHGPSAPAMAFRVLMPSRLLSARCRSALNRPRQLTGPDELNIPAIEGIGGLQIYLVDRYGAKGSIYDIDFNWLEGRDPKPEGVGLYYIDHLTHNVYRGRLDEWADFYVRLFNFRQIRFFDIEGKISGLHSRAMTSPTGRFVFPSTKMPVRKGRFRNISKSTKVKVSSTSRWVRATFTPRSKLLFAAALSFSHPPTMFIIRVSKVACRNTASQSNA